MQPTTSPARYKMWPRAADGGMTPSLGSTLLGGAALARVVAAASRGRFSEPEVEPRARVASRTRVWVRGSNSTLGLTLRSDLVNGPAPSSSSLLTLPPAL